MWILESFFVKEIIIYEGKIDSYLLSKKLKEKVVIVDFYSLVNVHMPKDRITQNHQGYGFIEFMSEEDADYAIKIMNMIKVYGKPVRVNKVREEACIQTQKRKLRKNCRGWHFVKKKIRLMLKKLLKRKH